MVVWGFPTLKLGHRQAQIYFRKVKTKSFQNRFKTVLGADIAQPGRAHPW